MLDVNVHPAKLELRFSNQNLIYDMVQETVRDALSGRELIPEVTFHEPEKRQETGEKPPLEKMWKAPEQTKAPVAPQDKNLEYFMAQMRRRVEERHRQKPQILQEDSGYQAAPEVKDAAIQESRPSGERAEQLELFDGQLLSREAAVRHVIIGQLFDTYWLVQYADKLYIIDQHAAHERVLYERLIRSLKEQSFQSQLLAPPIVLNLSMQEEQLYLKYQRYFADMGFEIEEFGDQAYAVRAVPSNLPGIAKNDILTELLDSLSDIPGSIGSESLLDKVASMSCKAAVKGHHRMSSAEARALIDELMTLENPYHCPHGRPTIISMTKHELEKKFKRIV